MKMLALLFLSGCFVLTKTTTTTRDLGTAPGEVEQGPVKHVELAAKVSGEKIVVAATAQRDCARPIIHTIEERKEKHARWSGVKDPRAGLFALVLAPITVPVTAIGTGIAVLADGDGTTMKKSNIVKTETFACSSAATNTDITVTMPSGAKVTDTTDENGIATVRIPETEPYRGVAKLGATDVEYAREMPAVTAVRETVYGCATEHGVQGPIRVELGIDERGMATRIGLDAGDAAFAGCVNRGIANTHFKQHDVKLVLPLPALAAL